MYGLINHVIEEPGEKGPLRIIHQELGAKYTNPVKNPFPQIEGTFDRHT